MTELSSDERVVFDTLQRLFEELGGWVHGQDVAAESTVERLDRDYLTHIVPATAQPLSLKPEGFTLKHEALVDANKSNVASVFSILDRLAAMGLVETKSFNGGSVCVCLDGGERSTMLLLTDTSPNSIYRPRQAEDETEETSSTPEFAVRFRDEKVVFDFVDEESFSVPLNWIPWLAAVSSSERTNYIVTGEEVVWQGVGHSLSIAFLHAWSQSQPQPRTVHMSDLEWEALHTAANDAGTSVMEYLLDLAHEKWLAEGRLFPRRVEP